MIYFIILLAVIAGYIYVIKNNLPVQEIAVRDAIAIKHNE